jgi:hypothetical protein
MERPWSWRFSPPQQAGEFMLEARWECRRDGRLERDLGGAAHGLVGKRRSPQLLERQPGRTTAHRDELATPFADDQEGAPEDAAFAPRRS